MITPADRQAERCPYPRPFSPDFNDCPAFQAIAFIAADSRNRQLGSYYTCRHLTPGNDTEQRGRFYPRCALGTREQRMQWLAQVTPARLEVVRALQREFDEFSLPHRERLFDARQRLQSGPSSAAAERQIDQLITTFLEAINQFLLTNAERFQEVGLPVDPLRQLIKEWIWAWVRSPSLKPPESIPAPVENLSMAPRAFLGLPIKSIIPHARPHSGRAVYVDPILQILPTADPAGLALVGDIDASNVMAVTAALASLRDGTDDVHLDLSGLLFCDLGGLQAFVRAAQSLGPGRKLVLHGVPRRLARAFEILEWAPLPNLSLSDEPISLEEQTA